MLINYAVLEFHLQGRAHLWLGPGSFTSRRGLTGAGVMVGEEGRVACEVNDWEGGTGVSGGVGREEGGGGGGVSGRAHSCNDPG